MLDVNLEFSWINTGFCILLGLSYSFFLYKDELSRSLNKLSFVFFILRALFVSFLSFLLINPFIKGSFVTNELPVVIIAKDDSKSIKENVNDEIELLINEFRDFEVFKFSFSDKVSKGISQKNIGLKTNYSNLFSTLSNKFENRNVVGTVLLSDGCYNTGSNPEYFNYDFPIFCVALGDTSEYNDIFIDKVINNDIAFFGNTFPLEVSISHNVRDKKISKLIIWNNNEKVHEEDIIFSNDLDYSTYKIKLPANKVGVQKYKIKIEPLNNEKNINNNIYTTYIDVIDSRHNILILKDGNYPDVAAYRSAVENNENYRLDIKNITDNIEVEKYQLAVLFNVKNIPDYIINSDIPLIVFNPYQSNYDNLKSPIKFILKDDFQEVFTYKYRSFSKFTFSQELLSLISNAPPLASNFGKYDFRGDIQFVLNQRIGGFESNSPVIMIHEDDSRKVAYLTALGWWRWKLFDFSLNGDNIAFNELFLKLSQFMILYEEKSLFRLEYYKKYNENTDIILRGSLYNESFELINNKEIDLKILNQSGFEYNFQFSKENNNYAANLGALEVGNYEFVAKVNGTDLVKKGRFDVQEIQIEKLGVATNHQILHKISLASKGDVYYLSQIQNLIKKIRTSKKNKNILHFSEKIHQLINIPWILLILLFLISMEWFIRKYNGLI